MSVENITSVVNRIERELEDLILTGEFGPGDRIKENAVAARFGVSRAPVREACRSLQRDGLVHIVPNQGAFVRVLSLVEIVNCSTSGLASAGLRANLRRRPLREPTLRNCATS